jgi:hypothetical protein
VAEQHDSRPAVVASNRYRLLPRGNSKTASAWETLALELASTCSGGNTLLPPPNEKNPGKPGFLAS